MKVIERGWCGHFICGHDCSFRRNTLIQKGKKKIVISTVGAMQNRRTGKTETIGHERYYETMAFKAKYEAPYWEADTLKQLDFNSKWSINKCDRESDKEANEMHEAVVSEFITMLGG